MKIKFKDFSMQGSGLSGAQSDLEDVITHRQNIFNLTVEYSEQEDKIKELLNRLMEILNRLH